MERLGRMTDAGRAVLPDVTEKGFVIDKDILNALQAERSLGKFSKLPATLSERENCFPATKKRIRFT